MTTEGNYKETIAMLEFLVTKTKEIARHYRLHTCRFFSDDNKEIAVETNLQRN